MFFDLNVPVPQILTNAGQNSSKKGKGKQVVAPQTVSFTPSQVNDIEARVDTLVHLGYSVIAFTQSVHKKVDTKSHVNVLNGLLAQLRKRPGIVYLKRLSIILDEDSEKGFGLINANTNLFNTYDLLALVPTTHATFSLACLTHSQPSPLTAHIIALPLTLPRLPFHLKHTLIRTAIKNGAVFEINYVGALGGEGDGVLAGAGAAESGPGAKRNWWAAARELVRVTKGKGLVISGGVVSEADMRAPRDIGNLISILGLAQDAAHNASTKAPKSLVLRAQTRQTYRAVLSEPKLVIPQSSQEHPVPDAQSGPSISMDVSQPPRPDSTETPSQPPAADVTPSHDQPQSLSASSKKRPLSAEDNPDTPSSPIKDAPAAALSSSTEQRKKKRKKNKDGKGAA